MSQLGYSSQHIITDTKSMREIASHKIQRLKKAIGLLLLLSMSQSLFALNLPSEYLIKKCCEDHKTEMAMAMLHHGESASPNESADLKHFGHSHCEACATNAFFITPTDAMKQFHSATASVAFDTVSELLDPSISLIIRPPILV